MHHPLSVIRAYELIYKTVSSNSGVGVFFSRQDAGLLPAQPDSGNGLAIPPRRDLYGKKKTPRPLK
jgi:hypothetical protein